MLLPYKICICISSHSKFNMDWNLFFKKKIMLFYKIDDYVYWDV